MVQKFTPTVIDVPEHPKFFKYMDMHISDERFAAVLISEGGNMFIPHRTKASTLHTFLTGNEAMQKAQELTEEWSKFDSWVILMNQDFTEGRGPMLVHKLAHNYDKAVDYIMQQGGIYGSPQYQQIYFGINVNHVYYGSVGFNGYDIRTEEFID